eukprot:TRINITY_DN1291_c0_g1_i2.p1 TRINITY_DN1291_c0_g1~~TRINITY_DN1291_c0_g1_i2.p1  ORF type:complete len:201 (-),score=41.61 TRINITY_DN1291_c0_g1_i2:659-1213(-)
MAPPSSQSPFFLEAFNFFKTQEDQAFNNLVDNLCTFNWNFLQIVFSMLQNQEFKRNVHSRLVLSFHEQDESLLKHCIRLITSQFQAIGVNCILSKLTEADRGCKKLEQDIRKDGNEFLIVLATKNFAVFSENTAKDFNGVSEVKRVLKGFAQEKGMDSVHVLCEISERLIVSSCVKELLTWLSK